MAKASKNGLKIAGIGLRVDNFDLLGLQIAENAFVFRLFLYNRTLKSVAAANRCLRDDLVTGTDSRPPSIRFNLLTSEAIIYLQGIEMMNSKRTNSGQRRGFTLVELLVVIAIIGILVGMLLPAVQRVREAARRTACTNNMRQMSIAVQSYQSARLRYPPASIQHTLRPDPAGSQMPAVYSLHVQLLPEIEEQALYDLYFDYNPNSGMDLGTPLALSQTVVSTFLCPSATQLDAIATPSTAAGEPGQSVRGEAAHYLGCAGSNFDVVRNAQTGIDVDGDDDGGTSPENINGYQNIAQNGIFGADIRWQDTSPAPFAHSKMFSSKAAKDTTEVRDGTSNTIMFGENSRTENLGSATPYVPIRSGWAYGYETSNSGASGILHCGRSIGSLGINRTYPEGTDYSGTSLVYGTSQYKNDFPFGSNHSGGAIFFFADGSGRFLADSINPATFLAIGSMVGGEDTSEIDQ